MTNWGGFISINLIFYINSYKERNASLGVNLGVKNEVILVL